MIHKMERAIDTKDQNQYLQMDNVMLHKTEMEYRSISDWINWAINTLSVMVFDTLYKAITE